MTIGDRGFPGGSEVKASAWNVGDLGSIPGSNPQGCKESETTERLHFTWKTEPVEPAGIQQLCVHMKQVCWINDSNATSAFAVSEVSFPTWKQTLDEILYKIKYSVPLIYMVMVYFENPLHIESLQKFLCLIWRINLVCSFR